MRLLVRIHQLAGLTLPLSLVFCISIHTVPLIDLPLSFIFRDPVSFLDPAHQLIFLSLNHIEIVVGQLAPTRLNCAFHLFPLAFHPIGIHEISYVRTNFSKVTVLVSTGPDFHFQVRPGLKTETIQ